MRTMRLLILPLSFVWLSLILPISVFVGDDWRPVDPFELAPKTPAVAGPGRAGEEITSASPGTSNSQLLSSNPGKVQV